MRMACSLMLIAVLACCSCGVTPPQEKKTAQGQSGGKAMEDERVDASVLRFEDPSCEKRYRAIMGFIRERTGQGNWNHVPLRMLGNFVEEDWCRVPEPDWNCFSGYAKKHRGTEWFEVSVLHYPKDWPSVFGLNVSAGNNAKTGQWGVQFYYADQGKSVVGSGISLDYVLFKDGEDTVSREVHLGSSYVYEAGVTLIRIEAPEGQDAEMARLYASPDSLRDTGTARYDALLKEVETTVREHKALKRVYGEYKGGGIPPMHEDVPMTPEEEKAALEKARLEIGDLRKSVEENYLTFHKLLTELLPYEKCWKSKD